MSNKQPVPYSTTIHVRDHCLCLHAQRAARALARRFDNALKPYGVTNGQFSLMMSLNRPEPPPLGSVANLLAMDRTTLTAALKPLEKRGWITSKADPKDRRSRLLVLTEDGASVLADALWVWKSVHQELEKEKPQLDFDRLRHDLAELS